MISYPIRINKYLRDQNLASRREADIFIEAGKVSVNGRTAKIGMMIQEGDEVVLQQKQKTYTYLAYHKPRGLATQSSTEEESVITQWQKKGLFPIGRLDKDSEGLLILTDDRRITQKVLDASVEKEYLVHVKEPLRKGIPAILAKGMQTKTFGKLLPAKAKIIDRHELSVILQEGKRHQIRVMLAELELTVSGLKRIRIGHVKLGGLRPSQTRELTEKEVAIFFDK